MTPVHYSAELTALFATDGPAANPTQVAATRTILFTYRFASEGAGPVIALAVLSAKTKLLGGYIMIDVPFHATASFGLQSRDESGWLDRAKCVPDSASIIGTVALKKPGRYDLFLPPFGMTSLGFVLGKEAFLTCSFKTGLVNAEARMAGALFFSQS